jgi:hypothetical protein
VYFSKLWGMKHLPTEMVADPASADETPAASAFEPGAEPEGTVPGEPLN